MASETPPNQEWQLANYARGVPDDSTFACVSTDVPTIEDGQVLGKTLYITVDPYMRALISEMSEADRKAHYASGWTPGSPGSGGLVVEVLETKNSSYAVGDVVLASGPWKRIVALGPDSLKSKIPPGVPPSYCLGALGMPGLTAYLSVMDIAKPKAGEVAFVSAAAGAVGSTVGQILKAEGLRVIGSAGTDEKVAWLKTLGFDEAFNYKTTDTRAALKAFSEEGIDIYYDNVGGPTLEVAIGAMKKYGRIVCCGAISQYNLPKEERYGITNLFELIRREVKMQGFIVTSYAAKFPEAFAALSKLLTEGKLSVRETVIEGFEKLPEAFAGLFHGTNTGKMVVKV